MLAALPAFSSAAPVGTFLLQGVGSANVAFANGPGGGSCAAGVSGSNTSQINDMSMDIGPPDSSNDSSIAFFVAWAGNNTNGDASGDFKYDFSSNQIANGGLITGNGVVSNFIQVEGTGTPSPVIPIQGGFIAGTIDQSGSPDILTTSTLTFRLVIS